MKHNNSPHNDYKDDEIFEEIKSIFDIDNDDNANIKLKNKFPNLDDLNNLKVKSSIKTIRQCEVLIFFSAITAMAPPALAVLGYSLGIGGALLGYSAAIAAAAFTLWPLTLAGAVICSGLLIYRNYTKNSLEKTLSSGPTEPLMTSTKIHRTSKTLNKNPSSRNEKPKVLVAKELIKSTRDSKPNKGRT